MILFLKMLFLAYDFGSHVPVDIMRIFFIPDFLAESLKANENYRERSFILRYRQYILRYYFLLTLKIICSQNTAKKLSFSVYKFSSKHVSVWCQKKHLDRTILCRPRITFLKHFESKCLYISVYLPKKILRF